MAQPDTTALTPAEEHAYRQWLNASQITDANEPDAHYDYRGLFRELKGKTVPTSQGRHFPDTYKQHGHPTFSVESKYSKGANDGGRWEGEKYVPQAQSEVVIVDDAGTEHVFPPGFDPKRAAAIVGWQGGAKPTENLDKLATMLQMGARGRPAGSSVINEGPASPLLEMMGPLAHPETLTDFGRILGVPVDSVRNAMTRAMAMAAARSGGAGVVRGGKALATNTPRLVLGRDRAETLSDVVTAANGTERGAVSTPGYPRLVSTQTPAAPGATDAATEVVKNTLPNQKLLNELAIEARRAKIRLTPDTEKAAIDAVTKGASPKEAVATVAPAQASSPVASAGAAPVKGQLSAAEAKEVDRLIRSGKTDAQARTLIELQRELTARLGTPTPTAAQTRFSKGMRGKAPE